MKIYPRLSVLAVAAILLGVGMRFYGLGWGLPYHFHSDERILFFFTEKLRTEPVTQVIHENVFFFLYPPLLMHILLALVTLASYFHHFSQSDPESLTIYYLLGRAVSACFGSATLVAVYLLGKRLYSKAAGLLASILLAFSVLHVRDSHFFTTDVPYTFFVVVTVLWAARLAEETRFKAYLLAGVFTGLGVSTKQTAALVFPVILTAHVLGMFKGRRFTWADCKQVILSKRFWLLPLLSGVTSGIVFLLMNPYVLMKSPELPEMFHMQTKFTQGIAQPHWTFQFTGRTVLYWLSNVFFFGMGPLLELVCLVGVLWAFLKRRTGDLLILSFLIPYFYVVGGGFLKFIRYGIPMLPFLCILGARFLNDLHEQTRGRMVRIAAGAAVTVVVAASFLYSLAYLNVYRQEDVRIQVSRWIHENIVHRSVLLTDSSDATPLFGREYHEPHFFDSYLLLGKTRSTMKRDGFTIKVMNPLSNSLKRPPPEKWWQDYLQERLEKVDYIVMSDEFYEQYSYRQGTYPTLNQFYRDLFSGRSGFQLIKTFKTYPALGGYTINDDGAELTFRLFDHPRIWVFKRNPG